MTADREPFDPQDAGEVTLVRTGSGGVLPDGTTNHPPIDFGADPELQYAKPDPQDADPLTVPYAGWSRDDLSAPDPEWQPQGRGSDPRAVIAWVAVGIVFVAVLAALVVVTR